MPAVILSALSPSEKNYTITVGESIILLNFDYIHVLMRLIAGASGAKWDGPREKYQVGERIQSEEKKWLVEATALSYRRQLRWLLSAVGQIQIETSA